MIEWLVEFSTIPSIWRTRNWTNCMLVNIALGRVQLKTEKQTNNAANFGNIKNIQLEIKSY